jgi:hypothetical protein
VAEKLACWQRLSCRCDPRIAGPSWGSHGSGSGGETPGRSVGTRSPRLGRRRRAAPSPATFGRGRPTRRDRLCQLLERLVGLRLGLTASQPRARAAPPATPHPTSPSRSAASTNNAEYIPSSASSVGRSSSGGRPASTAAVQDHPASHPPAPARPQAAVSPTAVIEAAPQAHVLAVPGANRTAAAPGPLRALSQSQ